MKLTEEVKVKAPQNTEFIIHDHAAKRAGKHQDLRIKIANNKWASFAIRKGIPKDPGTRVLAIRTHDHTDKEALMTGEITDGYGAGELKVFDKGKCKILKFASAHITIDLKGRKIKGLYHMVNIGLAKGSKAYKKQNFMLFKSKNKLIQN
jgi:DNA ligase D-like protein (predicted 3'-phosphoesterase)